MRLRLARWIVDRYPRGWRDRYRDEVRDLLDDGRVTWADVIDLWRGCLSEWKVAVADPEHHPVAFQWMDALSSVGRWSVVLLSFLLPTIGAAAFLQRRFGSPPDSVEWVYLALVLMIVTRDVMSWFPGRISAKLSAPRLGWWIPPLAVSMVLAVWLDGLPRVQAVRPHVSGFASLMIAIWFMNVAYRPRLMSAVVGALGGRRSQMYWADLELTRCRSLPESDPSRGPQLDRAQAEVDRLNRELQFIYAAIRERRPLPTELQPH